MDLRHLRAFAAIVDAGGFARAAIRLNLSQPALSRQIAALEEDLGVPLFDRLGRRALLTSEGEDLLRRSRRLLSDAESLGERARALKGGLTGLLRVGATPQAMETLLAGFLARYRRRRPGVEVHLIEDGGARLPVRLEHGDVHLALIAAGDARFRWRILGPVYLLAVLPTTHRWGRRAMLEIEDLADLPLLITRATSTREHGSTRLARWLTSGPTCSWRAARRRRSWRSLRPGRVSRSFRPTREYREAGCGPCPSSGGVSRSGAG